MNAHEKSTFIDNLINAVKAHVQSKVGDMPEEWDGHELRRYIADAFEREAWTLRLGNKDYRHRLRDYRNVIATTTL